MFETKKYMVMEIFLYEFFVHGFLHNVVSGSSDTGVFNNNITSDNVQNKKYQEWNELFIIQGYSGNVAVFYT